MRIMSKTPPLNMMTACASPYWLWSPMGLVVIATVLALTLFRLYAILPKRANGEPTVRSNTNGPFRVERSNTPVKTLSVLGSGGHTAEMCTLIRSLDRHRYQIRFVVAHTDVKSLDMVRSNLGDVDGLLNRGDGDLFHFIPRSRAVHQSLLSSAFTTLYAFVHSIWVTLFVIRPDLILVNGPGTCVPVCMAAYIPKFFGLKHIKIIYVESVARVESLSVTGRILYYLADRFLVQWPRLAERFPTAEYHGRLS